MRRESTPGGGYVMIYIQSSNDILVIRTDRATARARRRIARLACR